MSKESHLRRTTLVLCVAMAVGCSSAGRGQDAEPATTLDLAELLTRRKVAVTARGDGMERVSLELHRLTAGIEAVRIPAGTYFVAHRAAVQNMVSTAPQTVRVSGDGWVFVDITAAAANLRRARPLTGDTFEVRRSTEDEDLRRLIPILALAAATYAVRQAAVWIATDDAGYEEMGTVVVGSAMNTARVIDDAAMAKALELCDRAGIDVTQKTLWRDRDRILRGLPEGPPADWLHRKGSTMSSSGKRMASGFPAEP